MVATELENQEKIIEELRLKILYEAERYMKEADFAVQENISDKY